MSVLPFVEHAKKISVSELAKVGSLEINYGFTSQTQWSGMVSDNQEIHPDCELVVKDWQGTWQEI